MGWISSSALVLASAGLAKEAGFVFYETEPLATEDPLDTPVEPLVPIIKGGKPAGPLVPEPEIIPEGHLIPEIPHKHRGHHMKIHPKVKEPDHVPEPKPHVHVELPHIHKPVVVKHVHVNHHHHHHHKKPMLPKKPFIPLPPSHSHGHHHHLPTEPLETVPIKGAPFHHHHPHHHHHHHHIGHHGHHRKLKKVFTRPALIRKHGLLGGGHPTTHKFPEVPLPFNHLHLVHHNEHENWEGFHLHPEWEKKYLEYIHTLAEVKQEKLLYDEMCNRVAILQAKIDFLNTRKNTDINEIKTDAEAFENLGEVNEDKASNDRKINEENQKILDAKEAEAFEAKKVAQGERDEAKSAVLASTRRLQRARMELHRAEISHQRIIRAFHKAVIHCRKLKVIIILKKLLNKVALCHLQRATFFRTKYKELILARKSLRLKEEALTEACRLFVCRKFMKRRGQQRVVRSIRAETTANVFEDELERASDTADINFNRIEMLVNFLESKKVDVIAHKESHGQSLCAEYEKAAKCREWLVSFHGHRAVPALPPKPDVDTNGIEAPTSQQEAPEFIPPVKPTPKPEEPEVEPEPKLEQGHHHHHGQHHHH